MLYRLRGNKTVFATWKSSLWVTRREDFKMSVCSGRAPQLCSDFSLEAFRKFQFRILKILPFGKTLKMLTFFVNPVWGLFFGKPFKFFFKPLGDNFKPFLNAKHWKNPAGKWKKKVQKNLQRFIRKEFKSRNSTIKSPMGKA